jgi:hypothetical protein
MDSGKMVTRIATDFKLEECPKCLSEDFYSEWADFTEAGDVVHHIACQCCGFMWDERY